MRRDIVVIGGGIIGSSIALYLAKEGLGPRVIVLEPDPAYARSSTTRSASALRTQFNLGINVAMSHFSYGFYNSASAHLSINGEPVDLQFEDCPYLILSAPEGLSRMQVAHQRQLANGADVDLLVSPQDYKRIPWLKTEGIGAATLGQAEKGGSIRSLRSWRCDKNPSPWALPMSPITPPVSSCMPHTSRGFGWRTATPSLWRLLSTPPVRRPRKWRRWRG